MAHGSSSRRNTHDRFHRVAPNPAGGGRERHRVPYRRYEAAPCDLKLPDGWHLNPNRVPIPPPPTGRERSPDIADRRRRAGPELLEDPRYAEEGPARDALFQGEHKATCHSFFVLEPPKWFLHNSVSLSGSDDDRDAASSDDELYQCLPEEMPPPGRWKKDPDGGSGGASFSLEMLLAFNIVIRMSWLSLPPPSME